MPANRQRAAASVAVVLIVAVVAALAFVASAVAALAVRARTSDQARRVLAGLPLVGAALAGPAPLPPQPEAAGAAASAAEKPAAEKPAAQAESHGSPVALALGDSGDAAELVRRLQTERELQVARTRELADRQERLTILREEIESQKTQLLALRRALDESWEKLRKERADFHQKVTEIAADEARNLKQLASTYERMKPERAALALAALNNVETMAKVLASADPSKRSKIMESLEPKLAAEVSERLILIVRDKPSQEGGL